jgi:ribosomal protein L11 methyltransferase
VAEAHWLEISLTVEPELAEALSEMLSRYIPNGVVVESGVEYNDTEDEGTPVGPVRVYGYIFIDENTEETRQRLEESLWHLGQIQPLPPPIYRTIQDEDWMLAWKKHYHPIAIGKKVLILPAWLEPPEGERVIVRIDPSMAFGTGTHPTTQLCLELIEQTLVPGQSVIDVGCGSGILSIAAVKLGARHVLAVDIDNAAVRSTLENATANQVEMLIERGLGSVQEIKEGRFSLSQAPLVLANILAPVINRLFQAGLAELVAAHGKIILSGILADQAPGVIEAGSAQGMRLLSQSQSGDWVALVMERAEGTSK